MGSLTALDILVLTLVGGSAVLGFSRGLVQEVTSLLAWILAIAAVRFFHPVTTDLLTGWVGSDGGAAMLAFVLLFGGVFILTKWGGRAMGQRSRASIVGGFDRGLGAGFGAVRELDDKAAGRRHQMQVQVAFRGEAGEGAEKAEMFGGEPGGGAGRYLRRGGGQAGIGLGHAAAGSGVAAA